MSNQAVSVNGPCVLGIDAAWTAHQPSGVALVQRTNTGWSCLAIAPSYAAFIAQASGQPWDPAQKATGSRPDPAALLQAYQQLAGAAVSCVSVDRPLATTPITRRRAADTAISSRFGTKGCAVHSPSSKCLGAITDQLRASISGIPAFIPAPSEVTTLSSLKPVEDMLDGLICAWIGIEHLVGRTIGLGDDSAAIWVPQVLVGS